MIVNCVLGFKAQAAAESEIGTHLPVILYVQSRIHHRDRHIGRRAARGGIHGILTRHAIGEIRETCKRIGTIESSAGHTEFVNRAESPSEFHEVLALRYRSVILQFVTILMVGLGSRSAAAACETPKHVDAYCRA